MYRINFIEPYKCTGKFIDDFQIICKQNLLTYVPTIIHRAKRSNTPTASELKREEKLRLKENSKKTTQMLSEAQSVMAQSEQLIGSKQQSVQTFLMTDHDESKEAGMMSK